MHIYITYCMCIEMYADILNYIDILFSHYPRVIDMYQVRISFCRICWLLFFLRGLLLPQLEFSLVRAATYSMSNMFQWGFFNHSSFFFRDSVSDHHSIVTYIYIQNILYISYIYTIVIISPFAGQKLSNFTTVSCT